MARLGQALAASPARGDLHELMANLAAYTGLRWGEIAALTAGQVDPDARVITVDRKVVEIAGHMFTETPKNRKQRRTIYPRAAPQAYALADMVAGSAAWRETPAGASALGLAARSGSPARDDRRERRCRRHRR